MSWLKSKPKTAPVAKALPEGLPAPEEMGFSEEQMAWVKAALEGMAKEDTPPAPDLDKADPEDPDAMEKIAKARGVTVSVAKEMVLDKQRIAKLEEAEDRRVWIAKAEKLPYLAGLETEQVAKILKSVHVAAGPEVEKAVEKAFASWNEAMSKSPIFKELGGVGDDVAESAWEEISKRAAELVEKKAFDSIAEARSHVLQSDPQLLAQYDQEKRAGA